MPLKRPPLVNNEIYHVVLRGVNDSLIFRNENDYYRGIFSLYEFNTAHPIEIRKRRERRKKIKASGDTISASFSDDRDMLIEILAFCFMPNHIHLLLKQIKDNGITQFMRKLGIGYACYFNKKYSRMGHLFQGRFKVVHIKTDEQLKIVFAYIHSNCVSLIQPKWKETGIEKLEQVINFVEIYKWSSYSDYIGNKNFPSVTRRDFLIDTMGGIKGCRKFMDNWLRYKGKVKEESNNLLLE